MYSPLFLKDNIYVNTFVKLLTKIPQSRTLATAPRNISFRFFFSWGKFFKGNIDIASSIFPLFSSLL